MDEQMRKAFADRYDRPMDPTSESDSVFADGWAAALSQPAAAELATNQSRKWIHVSERLPSHGEFIEAENRVGGKWTEIWNSHEPIGALVHWRAAPVCMTCGGSGWLGGPSYYNPGESGEPCQDCAPKATK